MVDPYVLEDVVWNIDHVKFNLGCEKPHPLEHVLNL